MKNPRTSAIPCVSANGATNVDTVAAARLPIAITPITMAWLRAAPAAGFAADVGADGAAPAERRRQYQAPISAITADSANSGRGPKRIAIGSATAGPSALVASAAAPYRPM